MKTNFGMAVAIALVCSQAFAGTTWKAEIWGPPRAATEPLEHFAKEVAAKTGGQLKIEFSYNKTKPTEAAELLKSGSRDATYICAGYFGDTMPLATVLELPMFAPDDMGVLGKVELALGDHPAIQAELKKWNAKMMIPVPLSQYQLMGTRRIARLDDFKGAKVRISADMGKILEEYGATAILVAANETHSALKSGTIDVATLPYPYGFATYKIYETAKYVTEKISLGTQLCYLAVNHKSFDALPPAAQKAMLQLRRPTVEQYEKLYAREDAANIAMFRQKGLEFVTFNSTDRARLLARAIKYWNAWIEERDKQGLKSREVFEFTQAKIREAKPK